MDKGTIAFGLTVYAIDANDLYVYDLNETNQRYRYQTGWEEFEIIQEHIDV